MNKWQIKISLLLSAFLVFQACSNDDDSSEDGMSGEASEAPATYSFESRFVDGESSVSYSGQVVRNLLIRDIKSAAATDGTTAAELNVYYGNTDADAMIATSSSYTADQAKYHDISTKNLSGKIDDTSIVLGFDMTADALMAEWFTAVETAGTKETADGIRLDQMIAKGLLGSVSYYQATSGYLASIDDDDNSVAYVSSGVTKNYTEMEHHWDESFGYFGASLDYGTQDNATQKIYNDSDASNSIDYTSEYNFDWAAYAAKRDDCDGCDTGGFAKAIFDAYVMGRHLITTEAALTDIQAQRTIVSQHWEKVIAANIIHYANSVEADIAAGSSDLNKHWAEMRAFGMCLQFNTLSDAMISTTDLTAVVAAMGNTPPAGDYATEISTIKSTLQSTYSFTDNDLANW